MATSTQYWNAADNLMYRASGNVSYWYELNATQNYRAAQAMGLWDDVSNFTALHAVDDTNLARASTTLITHTDYFLGIPYNSYTYWENALPNDWTRIAVGELNPRGTGVLGLNASYGSNSRYHEVYIDVSCEGLSTFQLGSRAFYTVLHELGHSIVGGHLSGTGAATVMNESESNDSSVWYASTPMTLDIDRAIALYGAATTTRTGDDTYGFNASLSGPYREAFDFNVNTRPLVTIYDNGGNDTLDASGFRDSSFNPRSVYLDLQQGPSNASHMLDGNQETFAVIYTTSWVENAVAGGGDDFLIGNGLGNRLNGGDGDDTLQGNGGNDTIYGGGGFDTAVFSTVRSAATIGRDSNGLLTVAASTADGTDTLRGVEQIRFADGTYSLYDLGLDDNDIFHRASLAVGRTLSGNLEGAGDRDYFVASLSRGVLYQISLDGVDSNGGSLIDTYLRVTDANGATLEDDDAGPGRSSSLTYVVPDQGDGRIDIDVSAYNDLYAGTYTLGLSVLDVAPTDISLSKANVLENAAGGTLVGRLSARDADAGDTFSFALAGGASDQFEIVGNELRVGTGVTLDYETAARQTIDIQVTDRLGLSYTETMTIGIDNVVGAKITDKNDSIGRILTGTGEEDTISGLGGDDTLNGLDGGDILIGGAGRDRVDGGAGNDTFKLSGGGDQFDIIVGGAGLDTIQVTGSSNLTLAGFNAAACSIEAWQGAKRGVLGTAAPDRFDFSALQSIKDLAFVDGGAGNDIITGTHLADKLRGNTGDDILDGGSGRDILTGGKGADCFVFGSGGGQDTITDYAAGVDKIDLTGLSDVFGFGDLHLTQASKNVVIDWGTAGESITIQATTISVLTSHQADFLFA